MEKEELTLQKLDGLVRDYASKREAYDAAKEISNQKEKEKYDAEMRLLEALKSADKKSYSVDGLGSVARREKFAVRVPSGDNKRAFLEYLQKRGEDVFYGLATVNYNTLNSFYQEELEAAEAGGVFPFVLPGIEEPTLSEGITYRKEVKKYDKKSNSNSNKGSEGRNHVTSSKGAGDTF
jgi:hypothetical protein